MDRDEILKLITNIGASDDIVDVRTNLATLSDEITKMFDTRDDLNEKVKNLTADNEKLQSANMQLFLKVGDIHKSDDENELKNDPPKVKEFNDFYNEKGELI